MAWVFGSLGSNDTKSLGGFCKIRELCDRCETNEQDLGLVGIGGILELFGGEGE